MVPSRPSGRRIVRPAWFGGFRLRHIKLEGADESGHRTFGYSLAELGSHYSVSGLFGITSDRL